MMCSCVSIACSNYRLQVLLALLDAIFLFAMFINRKTCIRRIQTLVLCRSNYEACPKLEPEQFARRNEKTPSLELKIVMSTSQRARGAPSFFSFLSFPTLLYNDEATSVIEGKISTVRTKS